MQKIDPKAYVADGVILLGDISIGEDSIVLYNSVLRGDILPITIGKRTNIQDLTMVHVDDDCPTTIGDDVTIGHAAIIHGCTIGDNTLIGMGAIIMNGAVIGKNCIIAAGALIPGGTVIPDGSMVMGSPGKIKRQLTEEEIRDNTETALFYVKECREMLSR